MHECDPKLAAPCAISKCVSMICDISKTFLSPPDKGSEQRSQPSRTTRVTAQYDRGHGGDVYLPPQHIATLTTHPVSRVGSARGMLSEARVLSPAPQGTVVRLPLLVSTSQPFLLCCNPPSLVFYGQTRRITRYFAPHITSHHITSHHVTSLHFTTHATQQ